MVGRLTKIPTSKDDPSQPSGAQRPRSPRTGGIWRPWQQDWGAFRVLGFRVCLQRKTQTRVSQGACHFSTAGLHDVAG